tara:strand:+ start:4495 stop:5520 length:1026 start_codon:yes stop_codon:yes gene_type:complete
MDSIFLDTFNGIKTSRPPVWFMRQAGRILPSYQKLKLKYTFGDLMKNKKLASEVTLLPINDLGVDAAILFSDILVIPESLGLKLEFTDKGPKFHNPLNSTSNDERFNFDPKKLEFVYSNIKETKRNIPLNIPLIGFCGGPLTTFLFMFRGNENDRSFDSAIKYFYANKKESLKIMDFITEASIDYLDNQVKSGIDCFQLFETYCGIIPSDLYIKDIMPYSKKILEKSKELNQPTIFFPKNFNEGLKVINKDICDFVSIDSNISLDYARKIVENNVGLQGNMDLKFFYLSYDEIDEYLNSLVNFGSKNHNWIFNLGRGFSPDIDHRKVKYVVDQVKNMDWKR